MKGGIRLFRIDPISRIPIYEQLYQNIIQLILTGALKDNDQLPSVRSLAKDLGVNPNTIQKAYQELERNGIIYSQAGRGNFILPLKQEFVTDKALDNFDQVIKEALQLGITKEELIQRIHDCNEFTN